MSAQENAEVVIAVLKRIGKWLLWGVAIIGMMIGAVVIYVQAKEYIDNRPRLISNLNNIELGEKLSDVIFKNPGFEVSNEADRHEWGELYKNNGLSIRVKEGRVNLISYQCESGFTDFTNVGGIACRGLGEIISDKFGRHLRVQFLKDKNDKLAALVRIYDIPKFGLRYALESNKVFAFSVMSPEQIEGATGKNRGPCD